MAGPFTVESLSPFRVLGVDENDELIDGATMTADAASPYDKPQDFASMIFENLKTAGVQQARKDGRIVFNSLTAWPGQYICAIGTFESMADGQWGVEGSDSSDGKGNHDSSTTANSTSGELRAGILIGPEFQTSPLSLPTIAS